MNSINPFLLATAGMSSGPIAEASARLCKQAEFLYQFNDTAVLSNENINVFCSALTTRYPDIYNDNNKGFGFYSWKAEFVLALLERQRKLNGGVVWLDAGCEINSNIFSKYIFRRILEAAKRTGGWFYALNTRENYYTKRDLIMRFPDLPKSKFDFQVQANFFVLHGERGETLARMWLQLMLESKRNFDFSESYGGEQDGFIEHRNDQSLLSLLVKSMNFPISRYTPPARPRRGLGSIKGYLSPVWVARNRSGSSILRSEGKRND
jgi:hypothetical protein